VRSDERRLAALDRSTWSWDVAPVPLWPADRDFFGDTSPDDVLVAERDTTVVGYVKLRPPTQLESNRHVLQVCGLAVEAGERGRGVGKSLVMAAIEDASRRGARRLTLHVLRTNHAARTVYVSCGFSVEGVLPEEFFLDGRFVDDLLLGRSLPPSSS
jgi:ribosomal protein S18 acetylase RimI-like enzyme